MKKSLITLALASAYASIGFAASTDHGNTLQPLKLSQQAIERMQQRQNKTKILQNGGVNIQLGSTDYRTKFKPEEGISGPQRYIIRLKERPVSLYDNSIAGLSIPTTKGVTGVQKLDMKSPGALQYQSILRSKQNAFIATANAQGINLEPRAQFQIALNALVAELDQQEAVRLAQLPEVAHIEPVRVYDLLTDSGPQHIGADKVWTGNTDTKLPYMGEGMVVGILDTGINSDHPSFAAVGDDGYKVGNPLSSGNFLHDCTKDGMESRCNDKLIGIWSYPEITDIYMDPAFPEGRPAIGEDYHGHGSHTASTVAGNVLHNIPLLLPNVAVSKGDGIPTPLIFDKLSGVAPHANIISYQVCYPGQPGDLYVGCPSDATLAALEQAIADGVDVINYSIGGSEHLPWDDVMELAFLSARKAGISVAVAAGNYGGNEWQEQFGITDHTSPWLTSVGATTLPREVVFHDRYLADMEGGDTPPPSNLIGLGVTEAFTGNIVYAGDYGDALCQQPFPAGTFSADQIVVCDRGALERVVKADNVKAGGAGGFILVDMSWADQPAQDVYSLPGIHLGFAEAMQLKNWLSSGSGHRGTIQATDIERVIDPTLADKVAPFSSRGPAYTHHDYMVPDLAAPGVNIYAAYADEQPFSDVKVNADFSFLSGTSMASPHVAGAMALIKQAHPTWTDAEVQSALMMTAEPAYWKGEEATMWRAGAGRINVAKAIDTGLLMDIPLDDYLAANPANGGNVAALNTPSLVNSSCKNTCSWLRTVTATRDGQWELSTESKDLTYELSVVPTTLNLKAGQTASIIVTAKLQNTQSATRNAEFSYVEGKVNLTSVDGSSPDAHWPVQSKLIASELPDRMTVPVNREQGRYQTNGLYFPASSSLTAHITTPVKPSIQTINLAQTQYSTTPYYERLDSDSTIWQMIEIPANTARFTVEELRRIASTAPEGSNKGSMDITIGMDINGDGIPQFDTEAICMSTSFINDYCDIDAPAAGSYWVMFNNPDTYWSSKAPIDTFEVATVVVPAGEGSEVQLTLPANPDGVTASPLVFNWDLPNLEEDDTLYALMTLGNQGSTDNVASIPVKFVRTEDDVSLKVSQSQAKPGDIIDVSVKIAANTEGSDRNFQLGFELPKGLSVVQESVEFTTLGDQELRAENRTITVKGIQPDTTNVKPRYELSTDLTDAQCRTPMIYGDEDGKYINLKEYGVNPSKLWNGGYSNSAMFDMNQIWDLTQDEGISLYHNLAYTKSQLVNINPAGFLSSMNGPTYNSFHVALPFEGPLDTMIAPFWRGKFETSYNPNWNDADNTGISVAGLTDRKGRRTLIVEWDNAHNSPTVANQTGDLDFEALVNLDYRFGPGEPEIIFVYDNISQPQGGTPAMSWISDVGGSIGVKGFTGMLSKYGPLEVARGTQYAYNDDIDDKVQNDRVVCLDYRGPEESQMSLNFKVRVDEDAVGQELVMTLNNHVEGMDDDDKVHVITVPANIQLAEFDDMSTDENVTLEGIEVLYVDGLGGNNLITVTGEHVTAVVHGNNNGATFDLIPEENFYGETEVTVTVADQSLPTDKDSKTFMLTVVSDGKEPAASSPAPTPVQEVTSSSGAGAFGFGLSLGLLSLMGFRRKH